MIYTITTDGIVMYANELAAQTVGLPIEKLVGRSLQDIFPMQVLQSLWDRVEKIINSSDPVHNETYLPLPTGSIWLETWARPLRDGNGKVIAILGSSRDITSRKRLEFALQDSEERFHTMFENHDAVMLLVEPTTGAIVDANISAQNFYGYSVSQLRSMNIEQINMLSREVVATQRKKAENENLNFFMFPHRLASGEVRMVEVHSSPIKTKGESLLFSIIHDVTDREHSKEQLRKLRVGDTRSTTHCRIGANQSSPAGKSICIAELL